LGRSILASWCAQRGLEGLEPVEALRRLQADAEANRRCDLLDLWLYAPVTAGRPVPPEILEPLPAADSPPQN
jgi:hypothetical protein